MHTKTNGGHISSKNISGEQNYNTGGGHIKLNSLVGNITAKTSGGHIALKDAVGTVSLSSSGGNIRTEETTGKLAMKTNGGNLHIVHPKGELNASTNGGNVEVHFVTIGESANLSTGAGTITLFLDQGVEGNFSLSGSSVDIAPEFDFNGNIKGGKATGTIGGGGKNVSAKTNYGKIILKKNN